MGGEVSLSDFGQWHSPTELHANCTAVGLALLCVCKGCNVVVIFDELAYVKSRVAHRSEVRKCDGLCGGCGVC